MTPENKEVLYRLGSKWLSQPGGIREGYSGTVPSSTSRLVGWSVDLPSDFSKSHFINVQTLNGSTSICESTPILLRYIGPALVCPALVYNIVRSDVTHRAHLFRFYCAWSRQSNGPQNQAEMQYVHPMHIHITTKHVYVTFIIPSLETLRYCLLCQWATISLGFLAS